MMAVSGKQVLFTATDPRGRSVTLSQGQRNHADEEHSEVKNLDIRKGIEMAQIRTRGAFPGAELLWTRNLGPTRWLVVVVAYEGRSGKVITAYGSKKGPQQSKAI
jgi:hypothetical protein